MDTSNWQFDPKALVMRLLEEAAENGELARYAERNDLTYEDAMIAFAEREFAPYRKIAEKYSEKRRALELAQHPEYVPHATPVEADDEAAIQLSLGTFAKLEESPPVDPDDARLNRRAEAYVKRHNVGYEAALTAVLEGEVNA